MKYRFFTLKQAENALHLAEKNVAPRIDEVFRPTRLEQMIFEDAGGDAENKALTELFHLLYASEHRPTEADLRFSAANCRAAVVNMLQNQPEYGGIAAFLRRKRFRCDENRENVGADCFGDRKALDGRARQTADGFVKALRKTEPFT